jgi:GxxExxY protein
MNANEPQMNANVAELNGLSQRIIGCAFTVANTLGSGFLERVYQNALAHELGKAGVSVARQHGLAVVYDGIIVGNYIADLLVEDLILIELKAVQPLDPVHRAQCVNYLRASGLNLCLLINFGAPRLQVRRVVHDL